MALNTHPTRQSLLKQIAQIQRMEPGKLCVMRQGPDGAYYNLQCREKGKTLSRYVPADQSDMVAEHTANYQRFQDLVGQYAALVIAQTRAEREAGVRKKDRAAEILLARDEEIQHLMARFQSQAPQGQLVQELELLVRTGLFKSGRALVGVLLQQAADRSDAAYQTKPGEQRNGRETLQAQCLFGTFPLARDYYHHSGKH